MNIFFQIYHQWVKVLTVFAKNQRFSEALKLKTHKGSIKKLDFFEIYHDKFFLKKFNTFTIENFE